MRTVARNLKSNSLSFAIVGLLWVVAAGCAMQKTLDCGDRCPPLNMQPGCNPSQLESADPICLPCGESPMSEGSPLDLDESAITSERILELSLEDCVHQALHSSKIMRDLGATVLRSPAMASSVLDPAVTFSDPRLGEEAALSAFDANYFARNMFERNDRGLNNQFFGNNGFFNQELNTLQTGVNKRSATGGFFTYRSVTTYDRNNQLSNRFPFDSWETYLEAEVRQPLLQGFGTQINRITGPGSNIGEFNGVLLARVRSDISVVDFEKAVRDFLAEVENAYWDLYYAYRSLEARIDVRDIAQETLDLQDPNTTSRGKVAQAEEQVYRFQADIIDALNGRPVDATRTNNGSSAGTFRGTGGLRIAERRLRLLLGLPINDGCLIKPCDVPILAPVTLDWASCLAQALQERTELRKQKWVIKRTELELLANKNFLRPQLDVVSAVRMRGFGEEFLGPNSASTSLYDGQFQEWQVGLEYNAPAGFRRAHSAVHNARLKLARENEVLKEQKRYVTFGLSNAMSEMRRAYQNVTLQRKRLDAIVDQLNAIEAKGAAGEKAELDVRLETHRRLLDARLRYHQAEVEYVLALRNVNFEKGTLLEYCHVHLSEAMAPASSYEQAREKRKSHDPSAQPSHRDPVIGTPHR